MIEKVIAMSCIQALEYVYFNRSGVDNFAIISIQETSNGGNGFEFTVSGCCKDVLTVNFDDVNPNYLKEQGYDVIGVGGRKNDNGFFADRGMSYYSVDIKDPKSFDVLPTDDVYAVAHFASSLPSRYAFDPIDLFESITIGTLNVLNWMQKVNCKKIVFPQTPSDMAKFHNQEGMIPCDATRHFPLTGDHAIYTIAKNAAVDLMEHYQAEYGIQFFALRFLWTNTTTNSRQSTCHFQSFGSLQKLSTLNIFNESGDKYVYGATLHTLRIGTIQTTRSL